MIVPYFPAPAGNYPDQGGSPYMVVVAQLVEPRIVIPVVAGSSPVIHPTTHFVVVIIFVN